MWSLRIVFVAITAIKFGEPIPLSENVLENRLSEGGMVPVRPLAQGRIVGGNYASIESAPWTCSLQRFGSHRCGCGIISPLLALTAAHCAVHIPGNDFYVRAGSDYKNSGGQLVPTRYVDIHPTFNEAILEHDICVVYLALSLNTALPGISPIDMAPSGLVLQSGTMSSVSGWGPTFDFGPDSETLRTVSHPVFDSSECGARHGGATTHDMMCAGLDAGGVAACDPGSPLVSGGMLVGVMSWSTGCGRPTLPSVYSRVATARLWIQFSIDRNT